MIVSCASKRASSRKSGGVDVASSNRQVSPRAAVDPTISILTLGVGADVRKQENKSLLCHTKRNIESHLITEWVSQNKNKMADGIQLFLRQPAAFFL